MNAEPPTEPPLLGRIAVVTGGHRGIGAAISIALARAGADVLVIDRNGGDGSPVPAQLAALKVRTWALRADLTDAAEAARVADEALLLTKGRVDILVNNAGSASIAPIATTALADLDATMALNLRSPLVLAQKFGAVMREAGRGAIVNISSVAGTRALHAHAAYCASKAALDMLTRCMALEWAPHGVRANAVAPTVVMTAMGRIVWGPPEKGAPMLARIPQARFAEPHEVADVVVFLASDGAAMVNGQVIAVDGGYTAH